MATTIFLIMQDTAKQHELAAELRVFGFYVNEYMTVREFFLYKENHKRGVVATEMRISKELGKLE